MVKSLWWTPAALLAGLLAATSPKSPSLWAAQRWPEELAAGPFVCHADFSLERHQPLLAETAQLQQDLSSALGVGPPREAIHLFLFERKTTYETYVRRHFPGTPCRRALFIKASGPGMVFAYRGADFEMDVRHEGVHALLHAVLPLVPLWLDEGLAEYFEEPRRRRASAHPYLAAVKWKVRWGWRASIEDLEQVRDVNDMGQTHYREAWAWVHFMLHGPAEARDELTQFIADLEAHSPPA